jgi:hypothetical protein
MAIEEPTGAPLRPFFPTADDFAAATTPHFSFLLDEFGYAGPAVSEQPETAYDVRYDGDRTAVLLSWEIESALFGCQMAPRAPDGGLDPDYENWLSLNEVLGARGAADRWVAQSDFDDIDERGYAAVMQREAENLRTYCGDLLRGDWSVREAAQRWLNGSPNA